MTESEHDRCGKDCEDERNKISQEYKIIEESLLQDLESCKAEQLRLRLELETVRCESKSAADLARESFSHANVEKSMGNEDYQELLANQQKRISILEKEKESHFDMWQMALKTIDTLDEELRETRNDGRVTKYHEEQINGIKQTYSEAIKALESKLLQAKDNFNKHQALWDSNREKTENLIREKHELEKKLSNFQNEIRAKEDSNFRLIESLKSEVEASRNELERARDEKLELQEKLQEARSYATKVVSKNEEYKNKVSEALELVETAMREKDTALQGQSRALEETTRLESRLNGIVEEYTSRLDREITAAREAFERNSKKYVLEVKELKLELRDKVTILDRLQRENRLLEDEVERVRHGSEDFLQRSSANILELEQKLKEAHFKIETCEENCRRKYEEKIRQAEEKIGEFEARLAASGDRLRRTQLYSNKEFDERMRESDDRTKEVLERYSVLEKRLARIMDERENLACELRSLQTTYDREIARRENERRSQEARIRELQDDVQNANNTLEKANARGTSLAKQIEILQQNVQNKQSTTFHDNEIQVSNVELTLRLRTLQEKFDQRTKELSQHVETHQKLCRRWKDEAKSLTTKFQIRSKELRDKMNILRKENEELNKELLVCRQQLAHCRVQVLSRYDQGDGTR